jgi:hypothetical protein
MRHRHRWAAVDAASTPLGCGRCGIDTTLTLGCDFIFNPGVVTSSWMRPVTIDAASTPLGGGRCGIDTTLTLGCDFIFNPGGGDFILDASR